MKKIEFLERLEKLLSDVPYTERREALNYYTEYFDDADMDEEEVIRKLGSPEEVAHKIREDYVGEGESGKEAFLVEDETREDAFADDSKGGGADGFGAGSSNAGSSKSFSEKVKDLFAGMETWQIVLILVLLIASIPVWGGALAGVVSTVIGLIAGYFGIIIGLAAAAAALFVASVCLLIYAVVTIAVSPVFNVFLMGAAILLFGIALLCLIGAWKSITVLTPAIWRMLVKGYYSVFPEKEAAV